MFGPEAEKVGGPPMAVNAEMRTGRADGELLQILGWDYSMVNAPWLWPLLGCYFGGWSWLGETRAK